MLRSEAIVLFGVAIVSVILIQEINGQTEVETWDGTTRVKIKCVYCGVVNNCPQKVYMEDLTNDDFIMCDKSCMIFVGTGPWRKQIS